MTLDKEGESTGMKKETICVHSGTRRDSVTGGVNTPIYTSSSYEYLDRGECVYPRYFNTPNQEAVVAKLCELEGAEGGILFSSGMAAISSSVMAFATSGDHVVLLDELYGGTHAFATGMFDRLGIDHTFTATDADAIEAAITPKTRVIVIESPTNPLLGILDIERIAGIARERGVITIIDNTFATPINQTPLGLGIDIVVHSGTKYIGGHSDICCGAALTANSEHADAIRAVARNLGGSLNGMTCYLIERSLKTLALRVERQSENAMKIAEFLSGRSDIPRVNYPGLPDFPGHEIARSQMGAFGGMLSFELADGVVPEEFLKRLELMCPAVSLGGVETILCAPAQTSHVKMSPAERRRVGISDSLLRLSVGVEHIDDLVYDLDRALQHGK